MIYDIIVFCGNFTVSLIPYAFSLIDNILLFLNLNIIIYYNIQNVTDCNIQIYTWLIFATITLIISLTTNKKSPISFINDIFGMILFNIAIYYYNNRNLYADNSNTTLIIAIMGLYIISRGIYYYLFFCAVIVYTILAI